MLRRRLSLSALVAVLASAILLLVLNPAAQAAGYTITEAILQGRTWAFTQLQTFTGGFAVPAATNFGALDLAMADAAAPTNTQGSAGASCGAVHRTYVSWENDSGETAASTASSDIDPTGLNRIVVNRPTIPATATGWYAWWSTSADSHATKKACGAGGVKTRKLPSDTASDCFCSSALPFNRAPTVNTTHSVYALRTTSNGRIYRPDTRVREVCKVGCLYPTIQSALDSITDATATFPYTVTVGPGLYNEEVTAKSYVTLRGSGMYSASIINTNSTRGIGIPDTVDEFHVEDMTVAGSQAVQTTGTRPATRRKLYFNRCILGGFVDPTIDVIADPNGNTDYYVSNSLIRCHFDFVRLTGTDVSYYGTGNLYESTNQDSTPESIFNLRGGSSAGVRIFESGSRANLVVNTTVNGDTAFLHYSSGGTDTQGTVISMTDMQIDITQTGDATGNPNVGCFRFETTGTLTTPPLVTLANVICRVNGADTTGTTFALWIQNDVDFAPWTFKWIGGSIISTSAAGAGSSYAIRNEQAATTVLLNNVVLNGGTITATGPVTAADTSFSNVSQRMVAPLGDLAADACTIGEIKADNAGGTQEMCWCYSNAGTGRWACVSPTTTNGPTN